MSHQGPQTRAGTTVVPQGKGYDSSGRLPSDLQGDSKTSTHYDSIVSRDTRKDAGREPMRTVSTGVTEVPKSTNANLDDATVSRDGRRRVKHL